jgi:ribonuclease BN (tRNA processing enzyme)
MAFSVLMAVSKGNRRYRLLYDVGTSPDGVVENMHRIDIDPNLVEAIVCSHGHFDHTTGIDGLIRTLGRTNMPVLIHPISGVAAASYCRAANRWRYRPRAAERWRMRASTSSRSSSQASCSTGPSWSLGSPSYDRVQTGLPTPASMLHDSWQPDPLVLDDQALKLFGNSFLDQSGQVKSAAGEVVVECLEADGGEDDVVDAVEVSAIPGGHDPPIFDMRDRLLHNKAYRGYPFVESALVLGQLSAGSFFDRRDSVGALVSAVAEPPPAISQNSGEVGLVETVFVMSASRKCGAAGTHAPVYIGQDLQDHAVAFAVPRVQVTAVSPVAGRHQCAIDEEDFPGDLAGQRFRGTADDLGEELSHSMSVLPSGRGTNTKILTQFLKGHVPPQPAQTQTQCSDHIKLRPPADFGCPVRERLNR